MRLATALLLVAAHATPALAADLTTGWTVTAPAPPPAEVGPPGSCVTNQGAVVSDQLAIEGLWDEQGTCLPGGDGEPGNLVGMAFSLPGCMDGFVVASQVQFNMATQGESWHAYLWRDLGGLPDDACGLECSVYYYKEIEHPAPAWETVDWTAAGCPCMTFEGETLFVGAVYVRSALPPDWFIGFEPASGTRGTGFANLSGQHGDWQDLDDLGHGALWGVQNVIASECGATPVEASSWGAVKSYYR